MRKYTKVLQVFYFIFIGAQLLGLFLVRPLCVLPISLYRRMGILLIGFDFIGLGGLGLLKNSILLTRTRPLKYEANSSAGKAVNKVFIIIGSLVLVLGVFILIGGFTITTRFN